MSDQEWLKAAVADDSLVVQLLLRLSHSSTPPPLQAFPLDWTVRQRRSKSITLKSATARASPTTPFSWSAATSHSRGAIDGFQESSRPPPGSKVCIHVYSSLFRRRHFTGHLTQLGGFVSFDVVFIFVSFDYNTLHKLQYLLVSRHPSPFNMFLKLTNLASLSRFSLSLSPLFSSPSPKPTIARECFRRTPLIEKYQDTLRLKGTFVIKRPRHPSAEGYFWKCGRS